MQCGYIARTSTASTCNTSTAIKLTILCICTRYYTLYLPIHILIFAYCRDFLSASARALDRHHSLLSRNSDSTQSMQQELHDHLMNSFVALVRKVNDASRTPVCLYSYTCSYFMSISLFSNALVLIPLIAIGICTAIYQNTMALLEMSEYSY